MAKQQNLLKSTFAVSFMTITSRITGFLRDLVFAHVFGATAGLDAFLIAFRIPNFLRRLFAEGAFSQAFVPVLSEYRQKQNPAEIQIFLDRMAGLMALVLFIVTAIAILTTPWLVWIFAPGFVKDPTRFSLTASMLRITFPYLLFISLTAYVSGILNTYGKFSIPAFTPNLLNLALIGAAIFMAPHFNQPVVALAWGIFIGGIVQLLFQLPFLWKMNLLPRPKIYWADTGVRRVLRLMLPAVFGVSVAQLGFFIDTLFASFLRHGSIAWLYLSDRLTSFPLGVFGVAIATVILPHLARKVAADSPKEYSQTLDWGLRLVLLVALPATIGIMILANPILTTLFENGKFTEFDVIMAGRSLMAFAVGVPAFMLVKILASGFYSRMNIKTPVKIAAIAVVANAILDAILIFPLAHAGLALATALTSSLNAFLLFWLLYRRKIYQPQHGWWLFWARLLFANGAMGIFLWLANVDLPRWIAWGLFSRVWHLSLLGIGAVGIYIVCLLASGLKWKDLVLQ